MKKLLFALFLLVSPALAQNAVQTSPQNTLVCPSTTNNNTNTPGTCNNPSSTITVTNTFQSVFASAWNRNVGNGSRRNCLVQNNSLTGNNMWVYIGPILNATKGSAFQIVPTGTFNCANAVSVVADQISITGTAGDAFTAVQE